MAKFAVILPAAGRSSRFKDKEKKPFANLDGRAVWLRSTELFINRAEVCQFLIVISKEDQETFRRRFGANLTFMNVQIVEGGAERFDSVAGALQQVKPEADFVAVHDAVRPCMTEATSARCSPRPSKPERRCWPCPSPIRSSRPAIRRRSRRLWHARDFGSPRRRRFFAGTGWSKPTPTGPSWARTSPTTPSHRSCGACRAPGRGSRHEHQNHHEERLDPGRGDPESHAQAEAVRATASVRRGRDVGREEVAENLFILHAVQIEKSPNNLTPKPRGEVLRNPAGHE